MAQLGSLEQLEGYLGESTRSNRTPGDVTRLATRDELSNLRPSNGYAVHGQPHSPPSSSVAVTGKRTQEASMEPRKRLHGFQEALRNQDGPSLTPPVGIDNGQAHTRSFDMMDFSQVIKHRFETLSQVHDRQGIDVERRRLALLLEVSHTPHVNLILICIPRTFECDITAPY